MEIIKKIFRVIFWIILIIVAIYSTFNILEKVLWKESNPSFLGYKNFIVITGSMKPVLNEGDIVITKKSNNIKENDIISFRVGNSVITHRVVDIKKTNGKKFFITQGDANNAIDNNIVEENDIEGLYIMKIPMLGKVVLFLKTTTGLITLVILLVISLLVRKNKKQTKKLFNILYFYLYNFFCLLYIF